LLIWLLILAALAAGGWYGYGWVTQKWQKRTERETLLTRVAGELRQLKAQTAELADAQGDQGQLLRKDAAEIAALGARLDQNSQAISKLSETLQGGRTRVQLAAVEQVLLLANDRALIAHDPAGAVEALAQADARLAALNEPRLFKVREQIAKERTALGAVPKVDFVAAALSISSLLERLPQLPLRGQLPGRSLAAATALENPPDQGSWPLRLWRSIKQALRATFIVRREDGSLPRLLPPEQQTLVIQVGLLKLEGARLALLRGNTPAFRDLCSSSENWLKDYYQPGDAGVQAAIVELQRLRGLELSPPLPDISRSLALLREFLAGAPQ
jgi:uroporphyrin-3 C-methyltransferase